MRRCLAAAAVAASALAGWAAPAGADNIKAGPGEPLFNSGKSSSSAIVLHCRTLFFTDRPGVLVANSGRGGVGSCELSP